MVDRPPVGLLTPSELRERAVKFRSMAATATTEKTRDALIRLAERLEVLADQREAIQKC